MQFAGGHGEQRDAVPLQVRRIPRLLLLQKNKKQTWRKTQNMSTGVRGLRRSGV
jgi:hypothetical protein